ncbi:ORF6N domain-containing protein [Candidatus Woesearchaeota archaeon]|nr:ORF6N domain-containing protein [Candidatus Woesearchaeota archaeon]
MANNTLILSTDRIKSRIYTLRGMQVMLDRDLAELYEVKAIRLREQMKRNSKRFPSDFMFQLTNSEVDLLVSQNAIPSKKHIGGYLHYAFTEQGVANLSSVLTNNKAIEVNIQIMRAFVAMRRFISSNAQMFQRLDVVERKQIEHDKKFEEIY